MIRTFTAIALMALATPVAAQDAPQPPGPFLVTSMTEEMGGAVSMPSRALEGNVGEVTVVFLIPPATQPRMNGIARMDLSYEFKCAEKLSRTVAMTAWAPDGSLMARLPDTTSEWEAVNPVSPNEQTRAMVCDGTEVDAPIVETIAAFQALYAAQ